jgi:hypothetical protein
MLTIFEEFLLLSIHETKGTFISSSVERLKPGLVGAILAELVLMGKIQTSDNHRLLLINDSPTNDEILDGVLSTLKKVEKGRKVRYWINTISSKSDKIRRQLVKSLVQKGVVTEDDDRLLWVIPSPLQPESKASAKYLVNKRLRGIVLAQEDNQLRDIVLLNLLRACDLLDLVFLMDERKFASQAINGLFFDRAIKDSSIQTIQEIETAIAAIVEED